MAESKREVSERIYTEYELRQYDGENGPMLIAYRGIVYDVSDSPRWRKGLHEEMHFPGQDLTLEMDEAPHDSEVFNSPFLKRVGLLKI